MGRLIAEVVEDIKNGTWGSDIEYRSECEKLHELCDEILEIEKAKTEKIVAELEENKQSEINFRDIVGRDMEKPSHTFSRTIGRIEAFGHAIEIVRKGGVE